MKTNILIVALPEYVNAEEVIKQIGELLQNPDQISGIFVTPSDLMSLSDAVRLNELVNRAGLKKL